VAEGTRAEHDVTQHWRPVPLDAGEELAYARVVMRNFHEDRPDEELRPWATMMASDDYRAWVVREGDDIVANYGAYAMTVSLPGGGQLPAAGVTAVGVAQTHRRRGLLRAMMEAGMDEAVEHDEHVALLYASESPIYPRFGFGVVAPGVVHRIDRGAGVLDPVDTGLVRATGAEEALRTWPAIFEEHRRRRGGCVSRSDALWRLSFLEDPPSERDGASGRRLVHVPRRGYAAYRVKAGHEQAVPAGEVRLQELVATDAEAEAALWQHVCDIDLTTTVEAWYRPPDDPVLQMMRDPLRARTRVGPPLYARLLDVAAAFAARGYLGPGAITFGVHDPTRDQSGTYRLEADERGDGEVRRVTADAELTLPVDVAASVWLGGVRATQLAAARRLDEHVPGAAARLDRLLAVDRLPWTPFEF
jgi:predicted acetyltransferase